MKHIKNICNKLYKESCFYRHPKSDFVRILGEDVVSKLVSKGYLKDSPKIEAIGNHDYKEPCYEFGRWFRLVFNYHTSTLLEFIRYWVVMDTIEKIQNQIIKITYKYK